MINLENILKITNVLSDPTRLSIYNYIARKHKEVNVREIAEAFSIHPNVARLHLSKLEDVGMLKSENQKTGRGGRPSRVYRLSDDVIELSFPFRDYRLLAKIALETMLKLGPKAEKSLYETGYQYGKKLMEKHLNDNKLLKDQITTEQKLDILKETAQLLGFHPDIYVKEKGKEFELQIYNCPFKEVAREYPEETCRMHIAFIKGLLESLFDGVELVTVDNMFKGCESCSYQVAVAKDAVLQ